MMKYFIFFVFLFSAVFASEKVDLLSFGGGVNNFLKKNKTGEGRIEYKFYESFLKFHPLFGFMMTFKRATYTYAGISLDLYMNRRVIFAPSFSFGYYNKGNGKDLGYPLEFRTGIEISLCLNNKGRVGMQIYHISNAHLGKHNPGLESLVFFYAIPLSYR